MIPLVAIDLLGSPFDSTLQVSDIGLLLVAILFLVKLYRRVDQFEETLAKRLEGKIEQRAQPKGREIWPQPLIVKPHEEMTPLHLHEAMHGGLVKEFVVLRDRLDESFKKLGDDRSRSTGNLHTRIEEMDRRASERTDSLRLEMKEDFRGVHSRINDVLEAVAELRGKSA